MARFQTSTAEQINHMLTGFSPAPLSATQAADRDYKMADKLDKRGDEYQAAGNEKMAAVCRSRALAACLRADKAMAAVASQSRQVAN